MDIPTQSGSQHKRDQWNQHSNHRGFEPDEGSHEVFLTPTINLTPGDSNEFSLPNPSSWPRSFSKSMSGLMGAVSPPNIRSPHNTPYSSLLTSGTSSAKRQNNDTLARSTSSDNEGYNAKAVLESAVTPLLGQEHQQSADIDSEGQGKWMSDSYRFPSKTASNVEPDMPLDNGQKSGFFRAFLNGLNILTGVGILSTPFAAAQGGWLDLLVLLTFAVICCFTGILLRDCLESQPELFSYPDIGQAAFGSSGRWLISILLYAELYLVTVDFLILEGDNLSHIFPQVRIGLGSLQLTSSQTFIILTAVCVLPTVLLRNVSYLAYVSAGGVVASIMVVFGVAWVAIINDVGFHHSGTLLNLGGVPAAIGLYGFCYSGHAVFPTIYTSMKNRKQFSLVLIASFVACTAMYAGIAVMGYSMYGEAIESQITLNLPEEFMAAKITIWTTVVNPFTKYSLTMTPLALALEEFLPTNARKSTQVAIGTCIRTGLVASGVTIALAMPYFSYVMAFIGSFLSMSISIIIPCACFLQIKRNKLKRYQICICSTIIFIGAVSAVVGTYSSVLGILESLEKK